MDYTHYHKPTNTLFRLDACEGCGKPVRAVTPATLPWRAGNRYGNGLLAWGEPALPPECIYDELLDTTTCPSCTNTAKRPPSTKVLTPAGAVDTLQSMVNIRLIDGIENTHWCRGIYVQIPTHTLHELLVTTGAKPMARPKKVKSARAIMCELIKKGRSDDQILKQLLKRHPASKANKKILTKYRRELFLANEIGPDLAAAGSFEHQLWVQQGHMAEALRGPHKAHWRQVRISNKAAEAKAKAKVKAKAKKAKAKTKEPTRKRAAAKPPAKRRVPAKPARVSHDNDPFGLYE